MKSLRRTIERGLTRVVRVAETRIVATPYTDGDGQKGYWATWTSAPEHRVVRHRVNIEGWPATSRPLRVAFLSDLHTGSHAEDVRRLAHIVRDVTDLEPDLVCLGGDYVNGMLFGRGRVPPEVIAQTLAPLRPPLGTFAVVGDHDELFGTSRIVGPLRAAGVSVLLNESASVRFERQDFRVVGLTPDADHLKPILKQCLGLPAFVLAHDPAAFHQLPDGPYLMLCGHTHGGQISLPGIGPLVNMSDAPLKWTYGPICDGSRRLYVTSGIGTSGLPLRIGIPPEIALLEVSSAGDPSRPAAEGLGGRWLGATHAA